MDNWAVLDLPGDPVRGDLDQILALIRQLLRQADQFADHAQRLNTIEARRDELRLEGKFATLFLDGLARLPADARTLGNAHLEGGRILANFAKELNRAKALTREALIKGAQADAQYWRLLGQFSILVPGYRNIGRGLNGMYAFNASQGLDPVYQRWAVNIGEAAASCEYQRQLARAYAEKVGESFNFIVAESAELIQAAAPRVTAVKDHTSVHPRKFAFNPADLNPALRPGENAAQADDRVDQAKMMRIYNDLGVHPPRIDLKANDTTFKALGAHTLEHHGPDIQVERSSNPQVRSIEGRIYEDPPWPRKQNYSYRWFNVREADVLINRHISANWEKIRTDLALDRRYVARFVHTEDVGEGYYNPGQTGVGPRSAVYNRSRIVNLELRLDESSNPPRLFVFSAYPAGSPFKG